MTVLLACDTEWHVGKDHSVHEGRGYIHWKSLICLNFARLCLMFVGFREKHTLCFAYVVAET